MVQPRLAVAAAHRRQVEEVVQQRAAGAFAHGARVRHESRGGQHGRRRAASASAVTAVVAAKRCDERSEGRQVAATRGRQERKVDDDARSLSGGARRAEGSCSHRDGIPQRELARGVLVV